MAMDIPDRSVKDFKPTLLVLLLLAGIFLGISHSNHHYWDEFFYLYSVHSFPFHELLEMEPDLGRGLFPQAFFSAKFAFVFFLYLLDIIFPGGTTSLLAIQFIFALIVLSFSLASYLLLQELFGKKEAVFSSIILLFLPLSIYFSYKVLSEILSITFIVIGCWSFLQTFHQTSKKRLLYFLLAVLFLLLGVLCRFTSVMFFGAMALALFCINDQRYPRWPLTIATISVSLVLAALSVFCYSFFTGISLTEFQALLGAVTVRSHGVAIKIYSVFMTMQLFFIFLLPLPFIIRNKNVLMATIWALFVAIPFLFLSDYVEPRYFYMTMVPLAYLTFKGVVVIANWFYPRKSLQPKLFFILIMIPVLTNRLFFADLMPYEHDQKKYRELFQTLTKETSSLTFLVPWVTDYCLLKYIYPDKNIHLTWSAVGDEPDEFFQGSSFVKWAGGPDYIGSISSFNTLREPIYYLGWKYNQPALEIKKKMQWLKNQYVDSIEVHEGLKNHLAQSWVWTSPGLELTPVLTVFPYEAFMVDRKE